MDEVVVVAPTLFSLNARNLLERTACWVTAVSYISANLLMAFVLAVLFFSFDVALEKSLSSISSEGDEKSGTQAQSSGACNALVKVTIFTEYIGIGEVLLVGAIWQASHCLQKSTA